MDDHTTSTIDEPCEIVYVNQKTPQEIIALELTKQTSIVRSELHSIREVVNEALSLLDNNQDVTADMVKRQAIPQLSWIVTSLADINSIVLRASRHAEAAQSIFRTVTRAGIILTENGPIRIEIGNEPKRKRRRRQSSQG